MSNWIIIPKSIHPERVVENSKVFDFVLDDEDMKAIAAIDRNQRYLPDSSTAEF